MKFNTTTIIQSAILVGATLLTACGGGAGDINAPLPSQTAPVITSFSPTSGPIGSTATLTGVAFNGATAVKFNGISANYTLVDATSITATVPSGASDGAITVSTPMGTASSPTSFVVTPSTPSTGECPVTTKTEVFTESDRPDSQDIQGWSLTNPWGYNRADNANRSYPLVVNGCWNEGPNFGEDTRKKYPSFYLNFGSCEDSSGTVLADLIDAAATANYRIDPNRIYLTGFSQGGSGSFKIVRGMLARNKLFAGIVRVAGQSESVLADGAVAKTSLWYHIGLQDDQSRIDVARATYTNLKGHPDNASAIESSITDSITGYNRITKSLTRNGIQIVKMSEYDGMGHDPSPCYRDTALFDWLFSQSLACR
jgi:hypothetical protein